MAYDEKEEESMSFFCAENLKVGYQKKVVIDNIEISLNKGEILCLLGPNGCGKSTIIKTITDYIKSLGGTISIVGKSVNSLSNKERAKEISVVLTERIQSEMMSAEDIVATGRYPHTNFFGKITSEDKKIIDDAIDMVNGKSLKNKDFLSLSDGEKQRIMIARAICQESDVMILDEPTSFLDVRYKIEILNILKNLAIKQKKTIILSLHEIDLISKIADKVMLIKDNGIYKYGFPENIITDESIKEAYNINQGSFNVVVGNIELFKNTNFPKVFVLGGGGTATKIYRVLNKKDIGFYSGVLFKSDLDYAVSISLAYDTVTELDFIEISDEKIEKAKEYITKSSILIDAGANFVGINSKNVELIKFSQTNNIPILSFRNKNNFNNSGIIYVNNIPEMIENIDNIID